MFEKCQINFKNREYTDQFDEKSRFKDKSDMDRFILKLNNWLLIRKQLLEKNVKKFVPNAEFPIQTTKDITMLAQKVININFTRRGERDFFWRRLFFFQRKYICFLVLFRLTNARSMEKNVLQICLLR